MQNTGDPNRWVTGNDSSLSYRRVIASGGSGDVYEACDIPPHHHRFGQPANFLFQLLSNGSSQAFARKIIHLTGGISEEEVENEARVIDRLRQLGGHPNIVQVLRHDWLPQSFKRWYYIDMELCAFSLQDYIRQHNQYPIDPSSLEFDADKAPVVLGPNYSPTAKMLNMWTIGTQIVSALRYLHEKSLVHRDLKPGNVLYSAKDNDWKLTDFGISSEATSQAARSTRYSRGTSSYRAPELLLDEPTFNNKADIWAVGCILHELATGRNAFHDDWTVRSYFDGNSSVSVPLPQCSLFLQDHVQSNIQELLHKDYRKRPSAETLRELFHSYRWFLEDPRVEQLVHSNKFPSYDVWKTHMLYRTSEERIAEIHKSTLFGADFFDSWTSTAFSPAQSEILRTTKTPHIYRRILAIINSDPANFYHWDWLGLACIINGEISQGLRWFDEGTTRFPANDAVLIAQSRVYAASGQFSKAIQVYGEAFGDGNHKSVGCRDMLKRAEIVPEALLKEATKEFASNIWQNQVIRMYLIGRHHWQRLRNGGDINQALCQYTFPAPGLPGNILSAAWAGIDDFIQCAIQDSEDLTLSESTGRTALHLAVWNGHWKMVKLLLEHAPTLLDEQDVEGCTALHYAASNDHMDVLLLLLESGSSLSISDRRGRTPLHVAANRGTVIHYLLQRGADPRARDLKGSTPLHRAAKYDHFLCCSTLIKAEANVSARDYSGKTPLHRAAVSPGECSSIQVLIAKGSDVNAIDRRGQTPLHKAARKGRISGIRWLLIYGADVTCTDVYGKTARDYASQLGMEAAMLLFDGGKKNEEKISDPNDDSPGEYDGYGTT